MENKTVSKRKKDKQSDNDDDRREKKTTRRQRSRSREDVQRESRRKRRHSRSRSPNVPIKHEKRRDDAPKEANTKKNVPERKAKETDMLNTRTGGAYIPPARLRMMQAQITDKSSVAYQRLAWEALKKSIHGHINKINVGNIGIIIKELLKENIVRGRGLLCRSVIQAQAASPTFTNVYAALVAAVNSRFPNIGELLLKRLVIQFKRGFKRNDKPTCISSASFIAHLVNQRVAHEILALELLTLLVESPTDDSVEVAIAFLKECGQKLTEVSSKGVNAIFEMLRNILHEGQLDKRVQYMIEVMFQVWKDGFKDHPALIEELELVPEEEQFTHLLMLDDATDPQDILNVFKFDEKYEDNEQKYKTLSKDILGSDAESGDENGSEESGSGESDDEEEQEEEQKAMTIIDNTETNLVALRRTIYLTINSSLDFEECAHKLMKMQLKPGQEVELCHMFLDCCAEQRTYEKFYGLLAQRFCNINRIYIGPFEEIFKDSYSTAHRLDTNRLRNVSKFFAHLLFTDSISWEVMECVKLNEEDTTSSSRIYIKILFQELAEYMGLKKLNDRLKDPTLQGAFSGIFPRDNPKNTRFSINFFTSIGLGGLTDELREHLKQMPKNIPAPVTDINVESDSSSSSSSSSDSSSDSSSSDSEEDNEKKKSKKSTEKNKSKDANTQEEATNEDKTNKDQRWGHDGYYETYGENAQRHENRQERSEQYNSNRPRNRDRHQDDERNNRDERDNRRNNRNPRNYDENRGHRMDSENKRQETDNPYNRRRDNIESSRNERNRKNDDGYERPLRIRSDREENRREKNDDQRRNRGYNRDDTERDKRDNSRERNDRKEVRERNGDDDRSRYRNSEREKNDKGQNTNSKAQEDRYDRYKTDDRIRERDSGKEKRDKGSDRNEKNQVAEQNKRDDRVDREKSNKVQNSDDRARDDDRSRYRKTDVSTKYKDVRQDKEEIRAEDKNVKKVTNTKNKDRQNDESNEEESKYRRKEGKSKSHKNDNESRYSDKGERQRHEDTGRKSDKLCESENRQNIKTKNKKKKQDKRNKKTSESSSSDSSSSESSSSESEMENTGGRYWDSFDIEKPKNRDKDEYIKTPEIKEKNHDKRRVR